MRTVLNWHQIPQISSNQEKKKSTLIHADPTSKLKDTTALFQRSGRVYVSSGQGYTILGM